MRTWGFLLAMAAVAACGTKTNPAVSCTDGSCSDPNFPFCDTDGAVDGEAGTCIAVTCTPGEFGACRGSDVELRCDATGANFDQIHCLNGCNEATDGCRVCDAGETVCADGKVQSCDNDGNVVSSESCALGCFQDEPRCREIDPSNGLGTFYTAAGDAPDLDLSSGSWFIEPDDGVIAAANDPTMTLNVPSFVVPPTTTSPAIRVFVAGRIRLGDVRSVTSHPTGSTAALALLATNELTIEGTFVAGGGEVAFPECMGGPGVQDSVVVSATTQNLTTGTGGGGFATAGGRAGGVDNKLGGPAGGGVSGTPELVPLRGGCASAEVRNRNDNSDLTFFGSPGGGAVQLVSRVSIEIKQGATINANGAAGSFSFGQDFGTVGGGAGGGVLLEAPAVLLDEQSSILANGGDGASGDGDLLCTPGDTFCGAGGTGATLLAAAKDGASSPYTNSPSAKSFNGGSGGGGLGRVRINTANGAFTQSNTTTISAALTAGTIVTK